jgi:hypothetical protein
LERGRQPPAVALELDLEPAFRRVCAQASDDALAAGPATSTPPTEEQPVAGRGAGAG